MRNLRITLVLMLLLVTGSAASAQSGSAFTDPHGRYRLTIPAGWRLHKTGSSPSFRNGTGSLDVVLSTAPSPEQAVTQAAQAYQRSFKSFIARTHSSDAIAGHPAHLLEGEAVTKAGQHLSVLIAAQSAGGDRYFLTMSAVPAWRAHLLKRSILALLASVRFRGE